MNDAAKEFTDIASVPEPQPDMRNHAAINARQRATLLIAQQLADDEIVDMLQEEGVTPENAEKAITFLHGSVPETITEDIDRLLRGMLFKQAYGNKDTGIALKILDSMKSKRGKADITGTVELHLAIAENPHGQG